MTKQLQLHTASFTVRKIISNKHETIFQSLRLYGTLVNYGKDEA
ncbi:hypothetical protein [Sporosarcina sp. P37]|nr:hypothetical protein [Sporosarcina sp. P37]